MKQFIITVDTEADNQWNSTEKCTTNNARFIPRFQNLAEKYGFMPTYLTTYEMSQDEFFVEYMRHKLNMSQCEIGMHLHAWNNPPEYPLNRNTTERDFLIEYPVDIMEEKIKVLTSVLEDKFSRKMLSHRSGRWVTNNDYYSLLYKYGYKFDCSVTPTIDWGRCKGATGMPGTDYSSCSMKPYYLIGDLLEVPMSIRKMNVFQSDAIHSAIDFAREIKWSLKSRNMWLRPMSCPSPKTMKKVIDTVSADSNYAMFMIHSSELMPGGSPSFTNEESIEKLYNCIESVFSYAKELNYKGCVLSDFQRE